MQPPYTRFQIGLLVEHRHHHIQHRIDRYRSGGGRGGKRGDGGHADQHRPARCPGRVPRLEEVNAYLAPLTGFKAKGLAQLQ